MENINELLNSSSIPIIVFDIIFQYIKTLAPFIVLLLFMLIFRNSIKKVLDNLEEIGVKDFSIKLKNNAKKENIENALSDISNLSYDELQYFLIMCGKRSSFYIFTDNGINNAMFNELIDGLHQKGLIEKTNLPNGQIEFKQTEKGKSIHKVFIDTLYKEIT